MSPAEEIGAEIRRRREALYLTITDLAQRAGIHPIFASKVERGIVDPGLGVLSRLASALGCQVGEIVGPVEPLSPKALHFARLFEAASPCMKEAMLGFLRCFAAEGRSR